MNAGAQVKVNMLDKIYAAATAIKGAGEPFADIENVNWMRRLADQILECVDQSRSILNDMAALGALNQFEGPIRDSHRMAYILAELLDDHLRDYRMLSGIRPDDKLWHIRLTDDEMGILSFAWNDVVGRLNSLERLLDETFEEAGSEQKVAPHGDH
ncbi:hypothetical protein JJB09_18485 [Rhizobium sp. KVB221]|uniref:Uncharacterized protein n=1 Tax=Rhizobium setariae TaxID=2801340 RepID=A0A936YSH4_9HYPH|nr:hypothetical protein [Rhizobium setariae]MBL0374012.1 hypothetical protein [Rhizobium setariae]